MMSQRADVADETRERARGRAGDSRAFGSDTKSKVVT